MSHAISEVVVFTLDEIKKEAAIASTKVDINWDQLEDPKIAGYFTDKLKMGILLIPTLESIYTKLTSGKRIVEPDTDTALDYDTVENYTEVVAEELFSAYIIQSVLDRFEKVNSIIQLSGSAE